MVRASGGLPGFWKVWFSIATASGSTASNRFSVPTSWRTNGLLKSGPAGRVESKPEFGFLSVKNCRPAPGPPTWQVVHWVAGSLKMRRPRSTAGVTGFGFFGNSVNE
jgi:hypothetical protein